MHRSKKGRLGHSRRQGHNRRAVEVIELILTLPLITLAIFATLEINHRWHQEKMLRVAVYEAMKAGASKDGTSADAIATFDANVQALGINGATLEFLPSQTSFDAATPGGELQLQATASTSSNAQLTPSVIVGLGDFDSGIIYYKKEGL